MVTKYWEGKMEPPDIVPIKCALRYKPPVLILVYKDEATGECVLYCQALTWILPHCVIREFFPVSTGGS